jgi:type II secretory pathway pseudopilin PulG
MKKSYLKLNKLKHAGMGLVEVVVAIGISVVTLTGAAVFSSSLAKRAQQNFVEVSVNQLQSLITEQIRLAESELKKDTSEFKNNGDTFTRAFSTANDWDNFCGLGTQSLNISLPNFVSYNHVSFGNPSGAQTQVPTDDGANYIFTDIGTSERYGAFDNMPVAIGINKRIPNVSGNSPFDKVISLKTVIRYQIYGKTYYTKPEEIKLLAYLVCKS